MVEDLEERKRRKIAEREAALARVTAERESITEARAEAKRQMREKMATMERLDDDNDGLRPLGGASRPAPAAQTAAAAPPPAAQAAPAMTAPTARVQTRHVAVLVSFALMVLLPALVTGWYLWTRAADQYASSAGFSVRTEEVGSAIEMLGGIAELSGSSSSDTDILYKFIQSQELVRSIDAALDLRGMWSKADPDEDPVFSYHPPGTIEDLVDYWPRMVKVYNDGSTGLIDLEVRAFTAEDAHAIAEMIYDESSAMINRLSAIAREDAIGYSRDELEESFARLKTARTALTRFRNFNQIVDPEASIQSQMGLLSSLQTQLAETLIEIDLLRQTTREGDPRIVQAERRIEVIERQIADERRKMGIGSGQPALADLPADGEAPATEGDLPDGDAFASLVGEYESLAADREFAEQSYTAARAAFDAAMAEARRQSRYLAAHVRPTLAERAVYPDRAMLLGLVTLFAFLIWTVVVLVAYSLKDRR